MRDQLFHLRREAGSSIQVQIREMLVSAILSGQMPGGDPLPSSRKMAKILKVSRNTVVLAYQGLADDGYLISKERSGFYVDEDILAGRLIPSDGTKEKTEEPATADAPDWEGRFRLRPSQGRRVNRPVDWMDYPYPFIFGQVDHTLFPLAAWRDCNRQALGSKELEAWTRDAYGADYPMLIEQIRTRLLPRRGIRADNDQILITMGAQNALYMLASLLVSETTTVALEEPGYPDARNIFSLKTRHLKPIAVDEHGLPVDDRLDGCDLVYVTPSHQYPTTATMPLERRQALLKRAAEKDFLIIEDDYEPEASYVAEPTPALKSLDDNGRVIYMGSMSKSLFPGLRIGYLVASKTFIDEVRALRYLMMRHSPTNNQRTTAVFLSQGHHDSLVHRLHRAYRARWERMNEALSRHLPRSSKAPSIGGTSFWVEGPDGLDAERLAKTADGRGLIIEPGRINFLEADAPSNFFRLGFSSIPTERIDPGIELLAQLIEEQVG
ncbi:MAG: PLP-dependent aminotransferase family protein [Rhodospirillaceae bacterium]|nr:PLP-dependent aminotransferase family protein [Rhodospirillaceae bacterium]